MDRQEYKDLIHLTEAERATLAERMRLSMRGGANPKGERRRDKRWDFTQPDIAVCVEHPGGGISKFLVWARDISAGGMAFIHGGFLHVGSRCRIAPTALDGHRVAVRGTVTGCRLIEGRLHNISVKFEQRIDPAKFLADYSDPRATPPVVEPAPPAVQPLYTSLAGQAGTAEPVNAYITQANEAAKRLADSIAANDLAVVKGVCTKIKESGKEHGFASMADLAGESLVMLEGGKSITDATAQLQQLRQLCERAAARPKDGGGPHAHPPGKSH